MAPDTGKPRVEVIPRAHIAPDPDQPRTDADDELRASIANEGILEPIIVRPYPTDTDDQAKAAKKTPWMIVNGERRWRGADGVLDELPCIVRRDDKVLDAARRKLIQLAANEHKAMSPLDEGRAYHEVMLQTGMSIEDLADALGKPRSTVGDRVRLMELGPWLELIDQGKVAWSRAVESLIPLRTAPKEVHERAIERFRKDYRFQNDGVTMSKDSFAGVIEEAYRSEVYPLNKQRYSDRPIFNTAKHGDECDCGGVKYGDTRALHCANPTWWRPLHRRAMAEKKAKQPKSASTSSSSRSEPRGPKLPKVPNGLEIVKAGAYAQEHQFRGRGQRILWHQRFNDQNEWRLGNWYYNGKKDVREPIFDVEDFCRSMDLAKATLQVGSYSGVLLVSKDEAAFTQAVETWKERRATEYSRRSGEFALQLRAGLDDERFTISGPGTTVLVARLGVLPVAENDAAHRFDRDEDDEVRHLSRAEQLLDVARALSVVTDDADDPNEAPPADWCDLTDQLEAGVVLAGLAVALDRGLTFPTAALEAWERAEIARMRKLPLTRLGKDLPDPAADVQPDGNKWQRRKKRGSAKHAQPTDVETPVRVDADGIQAIRTAAEADDDETEGERESMRELVGDDYDLEEEEAAADA